MGARVRKTGRPSKAQIQALVERAKTLQVGVGCWIN
jgi:hypothetical protein